MVDVGLLHRRRKDVSDKPVRTSAVRIAVDQVNRLADELERAAMQAVAESRYPDDRPRRDERA